MKKIALVIIALLLAVSLSACTDLAANILGGSQSPAPTAGSGGQSPSAGPGTTRIQGYNVVFDLGSISIIDHNLSGSRNLELLALPNGYGQTNNVTIIRSGSLEVDEYAAFNDAYAIELYYSSLDDTQAAELVAYAANLDKEQDGFFYSDSTLKETSIRATSDRTMAYLAIGETSRDGSEHYVLFYIAQNIPGSSDVLLLEIVFYKDLSSASDTAILEELGRHLGIDLVKYINDLV